MLGMSVNDCSQGVLQYSGLSAGENEPWHVENNRLSVPGDVYPIHFSQHKDTKDTGTPCHWIYISAVPWASHICCK
jgi:hypothetical protein